MKRTISIFASLMLLVFVSCKHHQPPTCEQTQHVEAGKGRKACDNASFINADSANKMISSYLSSIHFQNNDTDIQSVTIDAADLRLLLDSLQGCETISHIQIKMAHTLGYINSGKGSQPAGYNKKALTFLVVGVNENGDYVNAHTAIINHALPCPSTCPIGNAASPLIVQ